ncbi:formylglycine-generating enzyme family protein [Govanella unica]|uniref:Formylglycine-generating enzyme family protein n=1 Tax=Govanella unica TaxID=2975056 RepID=A0A9X3TWL1_9PROT|nr:formylglycine-generating enzyme family protein [Govania unica]MDA5192909.1 formylglycine-generating enzyme family protein [Govania unica]
MAILRAVAFVILSGIGLTACATDLGHQRAVKDCADCPEMVTIPAGNFVMGRDGGEEGRYEGPAHAVTVASFALGRTEITNAQFAAFVKATGHQTLPGCQVYPKPTDGSDLKYGWRDPGYGRAPKPTEPVACVSWKDAQIYVAWLAKKTGKAYRLPTEAEWEYAARAGSTTAFHWGDNADEGCTYANMYDKSGLVNGFKWAAAQCDSGFAKVAPVASLKPNAFGLYDMLGNVWEWVSDCYVVPYGSTSSASVEVEGPCDRRSVRGGSWITRPDRNSVTFRGRDPEDTRFSMFGFRVALDLAKN